MTITVDGEYAQMGRKVLGLEKKKLGANVSR